VRIRFNCEVMRVENAGEEQFYDRQDRAQVVRLLDGMEDGDSVVINAVEEGDGGL
jgi:hypothetical protein